MAKALHARPRDAFRRETFALPREKAREKAREMFRRFPRAAYMTEIVAEGLSLSSAVSGLPPRPRRVPRC